MDDPRRQRPHRPLPGRANPGLPGQPDRGPHRAADDGAGLRRGPGARATPGTGRPPTASTRRTSSRPARATPCALWSASPTTATSRSPAASDSNCRKAGRPRTPEVAAERRAGRGQGRRASLHHRLRRDAGPQGREDRRFRGRRTQTDDLEGLRAVAADGRGQPDEGPAGQDAGTVEVGNHSGKALSGTLRMHVPGSWKALTPEIPIAELKPQEVRSVVCRFEWIADWKPQETAQIELDFGADKRRYAPADSQSVSPSTGPGTSRSTAG